MNMIQFKDWNYPCPKMLYNWLDSQYQFGYDSEFINVHGCRDVGKWVLEAKRQDIITVLLLPSRTDTAWFHDHCANDATIMFLRGRLDAVHEGVIVGKAGFPHIVVVFDGTNEVRYINKRDIMICA